MLRFPAVAPVCSRMYVNSAITVPAEMISQPDAAVKGITMSQHKKDEKDP